MCRNNIGLSQSGKHVCNHSLFVIIALNISSVLAIVLRLLGTNKLRDTLFLMQTFDVGCSGFSFSQDVENTAAVRFTAADTSKAFADILRLCIYLNQYKNDPIHNETQRCRRWKQQE